MQFNQDLLYLMFICVFIFSGQLSTTLAGNSETMTNTASYQGLHPDEFMKTWLVLGPIPVSQDKTVAPDVDAQKKVFAVDFLTQQGGETGIKPKSGLTHKIGVAEGKLR